MNVQDSKEELIVFIFGFFYGLGVSLWDFSESFSFGNKVTKYSAVLDVIFVLLWFLTILIFSNYFDSIIDFLALISLIFSLKV